MMVTKTMDEIKQELTKEDYEMLERAAKMPITFDEDCPELTEEDFKRAYRVKDGRPLAFQREDVTLNLPLWAVLKAKSLGKEYTDFLARIVENALRNPKIVEQSL